MNRPTLDVPEDLQGMLNRRTFLKTIGAGSLSLFCPFSGALSCLGKELARQLVSPEALPIEALSFVPEEVVIKVMGIGDYGVGAVDHMVARGIKGVHFIAADSDLDVSRSSSALTSPLPRSATEVGSGLRDPRVPGLATTEGRITELISGSDLLFIVAGPGGIPGRTMATLVAKAAQELGILTVAVVGQLPAFDAESQVIEQEALNTLSDRVDCLITIPTEKIHAMLGTEASHVRAIRITDDLLYATVTGIADMVTSHGMIAVDFADVRTVLEASGFGMMGVAQASGTDRARRSAEQALASPWLDHEAMSDAKGVLVNIAADESSFRLDDMYDVVASVAKCIGGSPSVLFGTTYDNRLQDQLRVTIVATGLDGLPRKFRA